MKKRYSLLLLIGVIVSCTKTLDVDSSNIDTPDPPMPASDTVTTSTINFKGVNWADPRDNFVDDWLVLSGLATTDGEATVVAKAETILSAFQENGANTVRLPINPPTVLQNWWPKYSALISKATSKGMKVILAYWEGASSKDGKVDDMASFNLMWDKVVAKYVNNQNVYFELFNEPHGYNLNELKNVYSDWLAKYPNISRRRILLDGGGYATDVNGIGDDSRFDGALLSFHFYTWFNNNLKTTADWEGVLTALNYPKRTVMTEFGVPMTNGKPFTSAPGFDGEVTYLQGLTSQLQSMGVGSVYWPGLRTNDTYSMFNFNGNTVSVNNSSGLDRLKYAWNNESVDPFYASFEKNNFYKVINRNSNKALDVSGSSSQNGGNVIQWDYAGGKNQHWQFTDLGGGYFSVINRNSGKALDVNNASTNAGAGILQWEYSGENNQLWQITNIGFGYYKIINKKSKQALDVNGGVTNNGGDIIQWHWNNGYNQQWQIIKP